MTGAQKDLLCKNLHLQDVSRLEDGDLLVVDTQRASTDVFPAGHFGPYVLTKDGRLQDVNYHYKFHHFVDCAIDLS